MAFVSLIFMYFIIIAVIACVSTLIGIILFIVSAVMKKKELNKKKEAWLAGNNNYQIKKTYIIPRVFGFISMIPLVICIISIVYISISPSSNNASGQETEYKSPEANVKEQASVIMEGIVNHDADSIINMFCEYEKKKESYQTRWMSFLVL